MLMESMDCIIPDLRMGCDDRMSEPLAGFDIARIGMQGYSRYTTSPAGLDVYFAGT
jgi:hypothetical protein